MRVKRLFLTLALALLLVLPAMAQAAFVDEDSALTVAENYIAHVKTLDNGWAGVQDASITEVQIVEYNGQVLAYNMVVSPSGHLLVAAWDEFSPVLLYSTTSSFDPSRADNPEALESWIIPELYATYENLFSRRSALTKEINYDDTRVALAWDWLEDTNSKSRKAKTSNMKFTTVGPLCNSTWGQGSPYNDMAPGIGGSCTHTVTGCVATAAAQLMYYWKWPTTGQGTKTYYWSNGGQNLSQTFNTTYDWDNMLDNYTGSETTAQKNAVAQLMYDMGIATEMNFGCSSSGSNAFAHQWMDTYFKYKSTMVYHERTSYTAAQWLALFKTEFDASPPRPVIFSIYGTDEGGHEVVADGYQTGATDMIRINYGWDGYYDGYYDITNNWTTGVNTWASTPQQIVTGIEPDREDVNHPTAVVPYMVTGGTDITALKVSNTGTSTVTINASLVDSSGTTASLSSVGTIAPGATTLVWASALQASAGGSFGNEFAAKFTFENGGVDTIFPTCITRSSVGQRALPVYKSDKTNTTSPITLFTPFVDKSLGNSSIKIVNWGTSAAAVSITVRADDGTTWTGTLTNASAGAVTSYALADIATTVGATTDIFSIEFAVTGEADDIYACVWQLGNNGERTIPMYKNQSTTNSTYVYY